MSVHSPCEEELSVGSSSLDNSELFQEKSPKKINRLVADRWTDNLCLSEESHSEREPSGDRVLGDRKVPKCVRRTVGGAGGGPGGCGASWEGTAHRPGPVTVTLMGEGGGGCPGVTPNPGTPNFI